MRYIINGDPIPLLRARIGPRRAWDSQKQVKLIWGIELASQHKEQPLYEGPLHLELTCFFRVPDSYSFKKATSTYNKPHTFKPDLSNLLKFVEDVATGILFKDDCTIASISAKKCYDYIARTEFTIIPLDKKDGREDVPGV